MKTFFGSLLSVFGSAASDFEEYGSSDTLFPTFSETVACGSEILSAALDCGESGICEGELLPSLLLRLIFDAANQEAPPSASRQQAITV